MVLSFIFILMGQGIHPIYFGIGLILIFLSLFLFLRNKRLMYEKFIEIEKKNWYQSKKRKYNKMTYTGLDEELSDHQTRFRLDEQTWNDLRLDNIFQKIDTTLTIPGQQALYRDLRQISLNRDELNHRHAAIENLTQDHELRNKIIEILANIGIQDGDHTTQFLFQPFSFDENHVKKLKIARFVVPLNLGILFFNLQIGILAIIAAIAFNTKNYYDTKNHIGAYSDSMKYMSRVISGAHKLLEIDCDILNVDKIRLSNALQKTKGVRKQFDKLVFGNNQKGRTSELSFLYDYINMVFLIEPILFYNSLKGVEEKLDELKVIYYAIGNVDMLLSCAAFRYNQPIWSAPVWDESGDLNIKKASFPLLEQPIRNDITVINGEGIMVTGSNMSGKSTFLRTVAVNIVLAQSIVSTTCQHYQSKIYQPYTSINISDNIESGESYYLAEVKAIKRALDASNSNGNIIVFIDEIFNGTNRIERTSAALEILDYLKSKGVIVFVATHDLEISREIKGFKNYFFTEEVLDHDIKFDYQLHEGISNSSNALEILKLMHYPDVIYHRAKMRTKSIAS